MIDMNVAIVAHASVSPRGRMVDLALPEHIAGPTQRVFEASWARGGRVARAE